MGSVPACKSPGTQRHSTQRSATAPHRPTTVPQPQTQRHRAKHSATGPNTASQRQTQRPSAQHRTIARNTAPQRPTQRHSAQHGATAPNTAPHRPTQRQTLLSYPTPSLTTPSLSFRAFLPPSSILQSNKRTGSVPALKFNTEYMTPTPNSKQESKRASHPAATKRSQSEVWGPAVGMRSPH